MAAKRKSRSAPRSAGAGLAARVVRQDAETVELAAPVVLPGDDAGADQQPSAPKAGPVIRDGGRFTGVGRGRDSSASRRYAFRRS
ncbi:hypothetical protein I0C86_23090 [Plantactinospora sp. S1510]|uniref:Uncharacterized protein n=1 Tax=Plantactinospora alkalitolerans TaxID=2789879 RepID=A0ABS0H0U0_9ACTN|nr:hypothetical protein [Plantactinospora alkalitolerans]MBF9131828.1 hypothetical protein [Plantactinospora alkalitolerans]